MNGNLAYELSARNFNPLVALAAKTVIAQVDNLLEVGQLPPDEVITPAALIDYIVCSE
ncbi:Acetate CoA-transferase subunit alpha [Haemophilus influenzae]|nr:Acetate CoA-transferase subunit alpha [Haemophilus influenzae]PRK33541.1 Acetate CoA-transferase subunit alpha [Haemophilus influenzae]PRK33831.1 Acetate CoA-transferase subunit alpha [Haemophilus influenzae]PRL04775.1 Acetate CoA-transferase subunit alpha [Haemophilus influenzae]PRL75155.1 Acetate CoA-transferase subunit alpha [Haemophilus influenzae]